MTHRLSNTLHRILFFLFKGVKLDFYQGGRHYIRWVDLMATKALAQNLRQIEDEL